MSNPLLEKLKKIREANLQKEALEESLKPEESDPDDPYPRNLKLKDLPEDYQVKRSRSAFDLSERSKLKDVTSQTMKQQIDLVAEHSGHPKHIVKDVLKVYAWLAAYRLTKGETFEIYGMFKVSPKVKTTKVSYSIFYEKYVVCPPVTVLTAKASAALHRFMNPLVISKNERKNIIRKQNSKALKPRMTGAELVPPEWVQEVIDEKMQQDSEKFKEFLQDAQKTADEMNSLTIDYSKDTLD
jgi:hypothetical protein